MDWLPDEWTAGTLAELPNWHFTHIAQDVIPALRSRGLSQADIDQLTIGTPRSIFAANDPY